MSNEIALDFGLFLREAMGPNATYNFLPFQFFHIGRTGTRSYTTTSRIRHGSVLVNRLEKTRSQSSMDGNRRGNNPARQLLVRQLGHLRTPFFVPFLSS